MPIPLNSNKSESESSSDLETLISPSIYDAKIFLKRWVTDREVAREKYLGLNLY